MSNSYFALVTTPRGEAAVVFTRAGVTDFIWPRRSKPAALARVRRVAPDAEQAPPARLPARLAGRVSDYFAGRQVDFSDVPLDLSARPPFQSRVLAALAKVGYGHTVSYGQLARRAGRPRAARAVGQAMAHNPLPLIVPCHRVLRGDGSLGGFSADEGVALKARLLEMERSAPDSASTRAGKRK